MANGLIPFAVKVVLVVLEAKLYTKQQRYNMMWMEMATAATKMSHCVRRQVGCVIVKDGKVISTGWNGTPKGFDNCCEHTDTGETLPYTIHAEANALDKLARFGGIGCENAEAYITTQPCLACAIRLANSGVKSVYYRESYRDQIGSQFLENAGIPVFKI